jgi:hypothetical protein
MGYQQEAGLRERIAELEAALAEARKDADYWDAENGRMLELCRTKLGKRDVHGVADGIEQLAEAREDAARYQYIRAHSLIHWENGKKHNRISWPTIYASDPIDGGNYRDRFDAAIDAARKP